MSNKKTEARLKGTQRLRVPFILALALIWNGEFVPVFISLEFVKGAEKINQVRESFAICFGAFVDSDR